MNKIAFSIKKYNEEARILYFTKDVVNINMQNILYEINNFTADLESENEEKIKAGLEKFSTVYNRKYSSIANQNFIITLSFLNEDFFVQNDLELFKNRLYDLMFKHFDILSFIVVKDSIGDITFYFICTAIVKEIFLDHIIKNVEASGKKIEDMNGVLSYNLLLGGTIAEKPEQKFIKLIADNLNKYDEYNISIATESEKQQYILDSYIRAANKITILESDISKLFKILILKDSKYRPFLSRLITSNNLDSLKDLIKK